MSTMGRLMRLWLEAHGCDQSGCVAYNPRKQISLRWSIDADQRWMSHKLSIHSSSTAAHASSSSCEILSEGECSVLTFSSEATACLRDLLSFFWYLRGRNGVGSGDRMMTCGFCTSISKQRDGQSGVTFATFTLLSGTVSKSWKSGVRQYTTKRTSTISGKAFDFSAAPRWYCVRVRC